LHCKVDKVVDRLDEFFVEDCQVFTPVYLYQVKQVVKAVDIWEVNGRLVTVLLGLGFNFNYCAPVVLLSIWHGNVPVTHNLIDLLHVAFVIRLNF
jgi:hypothetical protein